MRYLENLSELALCDSKECRHSFDPGEEESGRGEVNVVRVKGLKEGAVETEMGVERVGTSVAGGVVPLDGVTCSKVRLNGDRFPDGVAVLVVVALVPKEIAPDPNPPDAADAGGKEVVASRMMASPSVSRRLGTS